MTGLWGPVTSPPPPPGLGCPLFLSRARRPYRGPARVPLRSLLWSPGWCCLVRSQPILEGSNLSGPDTLWREGHLPPLCLPTDPPSSSQPASPGGTRPASPLPLAAPRHAVSRHPVRRGSRSPGARRGRLAPRQCACESPDLPLSRQVVEGLTAAGRALLPSPASVTASAVGSSPASQ